MKARTQHYVLKISVRKIPVGNFPRALISVLKFPSTQFSVRVFPCGTFLVRFFPRPLRMISSPIEDLNMLSDRADEDTLIFTIDTVNVRSFYSNML